MKIKNRLLVYALNILAMVFWAFSFIWYKDVYLFLQPFTTILTRLIISAALLFLVSASIGKLQKINFKDFKLILGLAVFEPFLYFVGESLGMQLVTPTTGAVIIALIPLLVPIFAYIFLKERLSIKNIIGVLLSFVGVLLVIITRDFELAASSKGLMLMGLAVIAAIFYSILLKRLTDLYNPLTLIAWQNLIGAVLFLPLVIIFDIKDWNPGMISIGALVPILKLAIFASSFAFLFYSNAVQVLGAVRANIFTNLIPVFTAAFSFFFLNETLILQNILGIVLVIVGLVLSQVNSLNGLKEKFVNRKY
jgi:drug/metabolite transporter (DMT)-like permease